MHHYIIICIVGLSYVFEQRVIDKKKTQSIQLILWLKVLRILKKIIYAMISSLFLFCISLSIWLFFGDSKASLQNILFIVGAVPIGFAAIGTFGNFAQRGDAFIQLSRTVSNNSLNERAQLDAKDIKSSIASGFNMFSAGLFLWLICYLL